MAEQPIAPGPGVCLSASAYATGKDLAFVGSGASSYRQGQGRWAQASNIEFIAGFPQKVAGWVQASASKVIDIPRAIKVWRDNSGGARIGIGTQSHLYYMLSGVLTNITPQRDISSGTLTNPLTTVSNSQLVAVADNSQNLQNGDWVFLSTVTTFHGVLLNNWYQVSGRSGTGYSITYPVPATGSGSAGGGTVSYSYPRVTLTNPYTTTMGSPVVKVTHNSNGVQLGDYVDFSGGSAVGGLTLNGEFEVTGIVDSNNYDITASSNATSSVSGGGGSVSVTYDIHVQQASNTQGIGWGQGAYGVGAWGLGLTAVPVLTNGWTLDAYGSQLLAAPIGGTIYIYDPAFGGRAYPMLNAPVSMNAMFVTPERFVVALGINGNLMEMAWSDQTDYTQWTTDIPAINTANTGRTLIGGSYFTGGVAVSNGVSLIFTDRCCFEMSYTGNNEVYNTPIQGDNCGLVSPTAVCVEGGVAYWMSDQDFFSWNGSVTPLSSDDVRAPIFNGGINRQYLSKCAAMLNRAKRQVRFFYPTSSGAENNTGVIYQYDQSCWSTLAYGRSCGSDAELLTTPVSSDGSMLIYYDETGTDANGAALPFTLGLGLEDIANGDKSADVMGFISDFYNLSGSINLTINTVYFSPPLVMADGPYIISRSGVRQDLHSDGRAYAITLTGNAVGNTFRLGVPRLDIQPASARR